MFYETSDKRATLEKPPVILPDEGDAFDFGGVGGLWKIDGADTGERFAVAHLPRIPPGVLGAPLHRHRNEDEYTFVLEGTQGTLVEDEVVTAEPGTWLFKSSRAASGTRSGTPGTPPPT